MLCLHSAKLLKEKASTILLNKIKKPTPPYFYSRAGFAFKRTTLKIITNYKLSFSLKRAIEGNSLSLFWFGT
jgi:hypothetical protein